MDKWYEGLQEWLRDVCEPEGTRNEFNWDEGLQELPKLAPNSRRSIFGIKTEEFLDELLTGEIREVLKDNYNNYYSRSKKFPFLPSPAKILGASYVPSNIFLFDNKELPESYREELKELGEDIPHSYFLIKKGEQYLVYGFKPSGIETDFAIFEYLGFDKNNIWCSNMETNKVLVVKNDNLFRDLLIYNPVLEPYII